MRKEEQQPIQIGQVKEVVKIQEVRGEMLEKQVHLVMVQMLLEKLTVNREEAEVGMEGVHLGIEGLEEVQDIFLLPRLRNLLDIYLVQNIT